MNAFMQVIKKHSSSAQIILPLLSNKMIVHSGAAQYTGALRVIVQVNKIMAHLKSDCVSICHILLEIDVKKYS